MSPSSALLTYLAKNHPMLAGKAEELRIVLAGWLSYIPQTFPHYTRHTIEHSDRIIAQLSKVLFRDDDPLKPMVQLSGVEAYILAASAMLHDAGMVVSDSEKIRILQSQEWKDWAVPMAARLESIEALRLGTQPQDAAARNFLADMQLRFLLAEFIRARHHRRSGDFLTQHQLPLGRFALDDLSLVTTIGDVCIAHGLNRSELTDEYRYPFERDILGEKVNVRLLAVLLRIGDLLDMDSDRACPLLLTAACPIPSNSLAHWTQYRRIPHRNTNPDAIEIYAECETQQEHRVLLDWCTWIRDELEGARALLSGGRRHNSWRPPKASIGPDGSIRINPSRHASYVPSSWRIELDSDAVLDRLINDTYRHQLAFVRELVQNALDTTRCQLHLDVGPSEALRFPENFNIPSSISERYPVQVSLQEESVPNELTGEIDTVQVVTVEDRGVGMSVDIIERFFLQVGRSYYQTPEFRRRFGFPAIGRHGVGFLSVFAVSEYVTVETRTDGEEGIKLVLTGPKNYLLRERSPKVDRGTRICVRLRQKIDPQQFKKFVQSLCRRVEFPIELTIADERSVITHESPADHTSLEPHVQNPNTQFAVTAHPFAFEHVRGEIYIFEVKEERSTSWAKLSWAKYTYQRSHPLARLPVIPDPSYCENGLDYSDSSERMYRAGPISIRMDYRGAGRSALLDRRSFEERHHGGPPFREFPELEEFAEKLLSSHLLARDEGDPEKAWEYMQLLVEDFDLPRFWETFPNSLRLCRDGQRVFAKLVDVVGLENVVTMHAASWARQVEYLEWEERKKLYQIELQAASKVSGAVFTSADLAGLSQHFRRRLLGERTPVSAQFSAASSTVALTWQSSPGPAPNSVVIGGEDVTFLPIAGLPLAAVWAIQAGADVVPRRLVINVLHPFGEWCEHALSACRSGTANLKLLSFESVVSKFQGCINNAGVVSSFNSYMEPWRSIPDLPDKLVPPLLREGDVSLGSAKAPRARRPPIT